MSPDYSFIDKNGDYFSDAIMKSSTTDFYLSDEYLDKLFLQKYSLQQNSFPQEYTREEENDIVKYKLNSHGFRSDEFNKETKLLFSGCSQTYGIGMHKKFIWPELVSQELGLEYSSLAVPGASVNNIVSNLFKYFRDVGHPETLFCLFPPFDRRIEVSINREMYVDGDHTPEKMELRIIMGFETKGLSHTKKYSQRPHNLKDILSPDLVYLISIRNIQMLEQYCLSNNIKFYWSTWDLPTLNSLIFISKKYDIFKGFTFIDLEEYNKKHNCHEDLMLEDEDAFYYGFDRKKPMGVFDSHFGSHAHRHISEAFLKKSKGDM